MRRIQIHIDDALDRAAAAEASRRGISKAALFRETLGREMVGWQRPGDPWDEITGWLDDDPVGEIDEALYGGDT